MFSDLFETIHPAYFFLSALLFMLGSYCGPLAVDREIGFLLRYPRWIHYLLERYFKPYFGFWLTFTIIFILNNLSLFSSFVSGFLVVVPPLAAFLTGFNVAVISYELLGWQGIGQIFINPVAWLEFPAAWISFSLGFVLAEAQLAGESAGAIWPQLWPLYLKYVGFILLLAALLETGMIELARKYEKKD